MYKEFVKLSYKQMALKNNNYAKRYTNYMYNNLQLNVGYFNITVMIVGAVMINN